LCSVDKKLRKVNEVKLCSKAEQAPQRSPPFLTLQSTTSELLASER
jgi:hypothetical protein